MMCSHHYINSIIQKSFTALEIFSDLPMHLPLPPNPWQPLIFSVLVLPFIECHVVGIIQHVAFSDWFPSLSNMYLTFFYVFLGLDSLFLFVSAKLLQSCPTLSNPMDCSLQAPLSMGILQARILECPLLQGIVPTQNRTQVSYVSCLSRQVLALSDGLLSILP